jgi:hypothetical protein
MYENISYSRSFVFSRTMVHYSFQLSDSRKEPNSLKIPFLITLCKTLNPKDPNANPNEPKGCIETKPWVMMTYDELSILNTHGTSASNVVYM